ncbi:MAG: hypothetical protein J5806_06300 [Lentisphaeria bacterium]|nr:hypothetical protein [Lentisphaeria bacterium]
MRQAKSERKNWSGSVKLMSAVRNCCFLLLLVLSVSGCDGSFGKGWKLEKDSLEFRKACEPNLEGRFSESRKRIRELADKDNPWAVASVSSWSDTPEAERKKLQERAFRLGFPYQHDQKEESIRRWKEILEKGKDPYFRATACRALALLERDKMAEYCDRGIEILKNEPGTVSVLQLRDTLRRRFDITPGRYHPDQLKICELSPGTTSLWVNYWMLEKYDGKIHTHRPPTAKEVELLRREEAFLRRTVAAGETIGFFELGRLLLGFCEYPDRRPAEGVRFLERAANDLQFIPAGILLARFYSGTLDSPHSNEIFPPAPPEMLDEQKAQYWTQWCGQRGVSVLWLESFKQYPGRKAAAKKPQ